MSTVPGVAQSYDTRMDSTTVHGLSGVGYGASQGQQKGGDDEESLETVHEALPSVEAVGHRPSHVRLQLQRLYTGILGLASS